MGKYHNILYIALKLCYDWQLQDNGTVATLLDHIFSCEKTFERLTLGALFGSSAPHFIAGWKSDFLDQEENLRALVFFLDHATNAGLEYPYGSEENFVRFIDVPLESCGKTNALKICAQLGLPDKMMIFLRYGAKLDLEFDKSESTLEIILEKLYEHKGKYPYNIVACLQLILRVVPHVSISNGDFGEEQRVIIAEKYPLLIEHSILPLDRCGFESPRLKHLCRCVIRRRLWENYQLPNGVRSLPVPETIRRYIDIMED